MKPDELFNFIRYIPWEEYITSGDNVQWVIKIDDAAKIIRLVFAETRDNDDWRNNFDFPVKPYKRQQSCMLVARGWGNAWKSCNDEVMRALLIAADIAPDYEIHICGWSFGGVMSVLAAEDFCFRTGRKASVYTFGSPKPFWGKRTRNYVRSCVADIRQWTHVNDIFPLMPPLPGYTRLVTDSVGGKRCAFKLLFPRIYHCIYGEESLYKECA